MKNLAMIWQSALMALQYLNGRRLRTALTTLAIVFGVSLMFAINLVLPSVLAAFEGTMSATSGAADVSITSSTGEAFTPEETLQIILGVDQVESVSGVLRRPILLPGKDSSAAIGEASQIELVGVDPVTTQSVRSYTVTEGRFLEEGDSGKAVLPASIGIMAPQIKVGTTFPLITAGGLRLYTVVGFVADAGGAGTPQIIVPLADAQAALNQRGLINVVDVAVASGADRNTVSAALLEKLGTSYRLDTPTSYLEALTSMEVGYAIMNTMGLIALFLGAFLIFNTFRTIVIERRRDLGMLRAIGARRQQIMMMILIESLIQGILGTVIGLALGFLMAKGVTSLVDQFRQQFIPGADLNITFNLGAAVMPVVLGLLVTIAAGYFPARAASHISPLEALRPNTIASTARVARRGLIIGIVIMIMGMGMLFASGQSAAGGAVFFMIGLIVAAPGLVMPMSRLFSPLLTLWYAREGDLARGNLTRQPGRAAITASTLMIGLATLILIAAIVSGFEKYLVNLVGNTFTSDLILMPQSISIYNNVLGADDTLRTRIAEMPEVESVSGMRYSSTIYNEQLLQVFGIDPAVSPLDFVEGDRETAYAMIENERAVIINSLAAKVTGATVGSDITLVTMEGEQVYKVAAIANDMLSFKLNAMYTSQGNLQTDFHKAEDIMVMVNLKPDADFDTAFANIDALTNADYPQFTPHVTREYRQQMIDLTTGAMGFFYALGILILIPAALGLLNTLTINVLERTREIGIVRAVGGSRKQIRRIVTAEALLLGLFGAAAGAVAGVAMSYGFIAAFALVGWKLPYEFPLVGIIATVIIAVLVALFASVLPARSAAKLDIIRAIQYE